jgi:hypothetical protein
VVEERPQAFAHERTDLARVSLPEEAVVHEDHLRAGLGGALEELA